MEQVELESIERRLTGLLAGWAVGSIAVGAALAIAGQRRDRAQLSNFGRQTLAWGAVDGIIAGIGALSRRRRGVLGAQEVASKARGLRVLLLANAAADVGYVLAGATIWIRGRDGGVTLRLGAGDGLAILVQGGFLLVLDAVHAAQLGGDQWRSLDPGT